MRQILKFLVLAAALLAPSIASAQCQFTFPLPANTVVGRLGATGSSGPCQAIPFAALASSVLSSVATGHWFAQNGGVVNRMNDRLLIGGATVGDGAFPNVTQDWLTQFQIAAGLSAGAPIVHELSVLTQPSSAAASGADGILGGAQSLFSTSAATATIGISGYAVNNNATLATDAWAFYGECHNTTSSVNGCIGMELDPRTTVASVSPSPAQQGNVLGEQLACGAGLATTGQDCSAAIQLARNPTKFKVGINFMQDALTGNDGTTGSATAIALPKGDTIQWYNSSGVTTAAIASTIATAANGINLNFNDNGLQVANSSNSYSIAYFFPLASSVNYLSFQPNVTGSAPTIAAGGTDTDIGINLTGKGAGTINLNSAIKYGGVTLSNSVTGTGAMVLATSPTLTTPILGVATATSINKVAITAPATSATLTIANGKTLTASNSLTLAGTDSTTLTFQGTDTYIGRATTDTLTNKTYDTAGTGNVFKINGTTVSSVFGSGSAVSMAAVLGQLRFVITGVNFNSANTDNAISISLPSGVTRYQVTGIRITNASASVSTATAGLFTSTGGGGVAIASNQAITVTATATDTNNNMQALTLNNSSTEAYNDATLQFRIGTAQGSAATADVHLTIIPLT